VQGAIFWIVEKGNDKQLSYSDVAAALCDLSKKATSPESRRQMLALARMYEKLSAQSAKLAETYPPPLLGSAQR
jgi:hypothetical protein